jgi:hypothetical protein
MTADSPADQTPDPATAERVREHEQFERSMDKHGLLGEDGRIGLDPGQVRHDTPPGTEQTPG